MRIPIACGIVGLLLVGCAKRPVVQPSAEAGLMQAHGLVEAGCYRCLLDAYGLYEKVQQTSADPAAVRGRLFSTALLLALREKELGLEATPWIERARAVAGAADDGTHLEAVEAIPWATAGFSPDFEPARPLMPRTREAWRAKLAAIDRHTPLDTYLQLTVACTTGLRELEPSLEERARNSAPLLRYRLGSCGADQRELLETVLAADPRFVEIPFFLARFEIGGAVSRRDWLSRALPHLEAAHHGLPEAPIVTVTLAGAVAARRNSDRALALYDRALDQRPLQREAMLGRMITLSNLRRHDEAIAAAGRMIQLGTWYIGDAHYWRAWNHYQRARLDEAAADIADARRTLVNIDVLTLAGMIAYDSGRRPEARADFTEAQAKDPATCVSSWYLGLLDIDESSWQAAVGTFGAAAACYRDAAGVFLKAVADLPADLPADVRQAEAAQFGQNAADSLRQAGRASLNAAQASIRLGDNQRAAQHARLAAEQPDTKERAEALLQALNKAL
jgi:tetratricopeptide (TPR) repeat protein